MNTDSNSFYLRTADRADGRGHSILIWEAEGRDLHEDTMGILRRTVRTRLRVAYKEKYIGFMQCSKDRSKDNASVTLDKKLDSDSSENIVDNNE